MANKQIEEEKRQNTPPQTSQSNTGQPVSNEEQLMRRQSAPHPTIESEAQKFYQVQQAKMMMGQGIDASGALNGFKALAQVIGKEQIQKANLTLHKYKEGKANLERRIVDNEQWYKIRHWECMQDSDTSKVKPTSAWLFNCIANKHADAMDNFPSPNILPREEGDKAEAEMLTSIIPIILEQDDFEETYSEVMDYKLKTFVGIKISPFGILLGNPFVHLWGTWESFKILASHLYINLSKIHSVKVYHFNFYTLRSIFKKNVSAAVVFMYITFVVHYSCNSSYFSQYLFFLFKIFLEKFYIYVRTFRF